jgi:hypothetical protein
MRYVPQSSEEQTKVDVMELLGWTVEYPDPGSDHKKYSHIYVNPPKGPRGLRPIPVMAFNFEDAFNYFLLNKDSYEKTSMVSLLPQRL